MTWIKICGITNEDDAVGTCRLGADALGFILSTDSPRRISTARARGIIKAARDMHFSTSMVGVFVNESIEKVAGDFDSLGLDYVQLSGDEDKDYLMGLKNICSGIRMIRAIRIREGRDHQPGELNNMVKDLAGYIDLILADSYKENMYGGTGHAFNWRALRTYKQKIPLILAGGLDSSNIKDAIRTLDPFGVDASSRLEARPGKKDLKKVAGFIGALR